VLGVAVQDAFLSAACSGWPTSACIGREGSGHLATPGESGLSGVIFFHAKAVPLAAESPAPVARACWRVAQSIARMKTHVGRRFCAEWF